MCELWWILVDFPKECHPNGRNTRIMMDFGGFSQGMSSEFAWVLETPKNNTPSKEVSKERRIRTCYGDPTSAKRWPVWKVSRALRSWADRDGRRSCHLHLPTTYWPWCWRRPGIARLQITSLLHLHMCCLFSSLFPLLGSLESLLLSFSFSLMPSLMPSLFSHLFSSF